VGKVRAAGGRPVSRGGAAEAPPTRAPGS
jgi:hypothetical protein